MHVSFRRECSGVYDIIDDAGSERGVISRYQTAWIGCDLSNGALVGPFGFGGSPFRTLAAAKAFARDYYDVRSDCTGCALTMRSQHLTDGLCPACAADARRYQVVPAPEPRYGHQFDVIDTHMALPENRIAHACVDMDHARGVAESLNSWHEARIGEGRALAAKRS